MVSTATNEHFSCASPFAGLQYLAMHLIICSSRQTPSEKSTIEESIDMELDLRFISVGLAYILLYRVLGKQTLQEVRVPAGPCSIGI